jgi:hypothetical protein
MAMKRKGKPGKRMSKGKKLPSMKTTTVKKVFEHNTI